MGRAERWRGSLPALTGWRRGLRNAVWSRDGQSLAVSSWSPGPAGGSVVRGVSATGSTRSTKVWFAIRSRQNLAAARAVGASRNAQVIADLAGWWPG